MQETMTPLMKQYNEIKSNFLNNILFFQLGDFYELFNDDAILVSSLLGLTLTKRGETPMCGIPVGNLNFYIKKLVSEASQTTEPIDGKGLVKREVTKIITKGNYVDMLSFDNNFILSIIPDRKKNICYICYSDLSTGETFTEEISFSNLISEIYRINPSEILVESLNSKELNSKESNSKENRLELGIFEEIITEFSLDSSSQDSSSQDSSSQDSSSQDSLGRNPSGRDPSGQDPSNNPGKKNNCLGNHRSLALIMAYKKYLKNNIELKVKHRNNQTYVKFGDNTLKNLDIFENSNNDNKYTLFSILNKTQTPEGKRYLKSVLCRPIVDRKKIEIRLDALEETLKYLYNSEKISIPSGDLSKMINNITDIKTLKKTSELILNYQQIIQNTSLNFLKTYKNSSFLKNHIYILENILEDNNNITFIHEEIRNLQRERDSILENIYALPEKHKISCKVKNNNLIGFFFEFTKNTDLIPKNWILKQGLSTSSRYTNEDLIILENQLKTIENQLLTIEKELFQKMKDLLLEEIEEIKKLTEIIGKLDFILSCAQNAIELSLTRPKFSEEHLSKENKINIQGSFHPVLFSKDRNFIDNDLFLDDSVSQIIITGPNMGGKSTFLRQNALCILMAQCGMFVPAKIYESKIFSSLFVRMGASDNIAEKESTFMVEMKECSNIINSIDENSFVVLDEIGRGTSTRDGISISMAIIEYISQEIKCFALISTHYKELCSLTLPKLQFFKADVKISNNNLISNRISNRIIFLYRIVPGVAEDSFGIHVAEMSNLPNSIINRAKFLLNSINS